MALRYEIPGADPLEIEHLLLDVNGTLTDRGELIDGVEERVGRIREDVEVHLLSADTFGALDRVAEQLGVEARRVGSAAEKVGFANQLGRERCAAIGNGRNDGEMLYEVRLGIAVLGPEGTSGYAVRIADIFCISIGSALDLLLDPKAIVATLRP